MPCGSAQQKNPGKATKLDLTLGSLTLASLDSLSRFHGICVYDLLESVQQSVVRLALG